jgi:RES domain-containing protein
VTKSRIVGAVFRADHPAHTDLSRTADASREEPGRFNTSRFGAVYLCLEPDTAIRERRRSHGNVEHPCALFVVALSAERTIDLTIDKELERWELTRDDLTSDDLSRSQKMAEAAFDSGAEAIMWPSATGRGVSLAVFLDRLASSSKLDLLHTFELTPTVFNSVDAGVPIETIHPVLSTFAPIARGAEAPHPEDDGRAKSS